MSRILQIAKGLMIVNDCEQKNVVLPALPSELETCGYVGLLLLLNETT